MSVLVEIWCDIIVTIFALTVLIIVFNKGADHEDEHQS